MVAEAIQADDPDRDVVRGVALLQLAAIHAAQAEGFSLQQVLEIEGLPELHWFEAEVSWKARLVGDPAIFARYEQLVAEHQGRLGRPVTPLDDDLRAWVAFLRAYGSHPAPFELLAELGLGLNDLARLSRLWRRRFDSEANQAKQAEKLAAKHELRWQRHAQLPELPPIQVGEPRLLPSELAGSYRQVQSAGVEEEPGHEAVPVLGLDRYAALVAELELAGAGAAPVLARFDLDEAAAAAIDEAWRARLDSDDELAADFRILVAHYRNAAARRQRAGDLELSVGRTPSAASPHGPPTAAVVRPQAQVPSSPRPSPWRSTQSAGGRPLASTSSQLDATALAIPTLGAVDVLPFSGRAASPPPVAVAAQLPARAADVDGTSAIIPALLESEVTPFDPEPRARAQDLLVPRASVTELSTAAGGGRGRFITLPFRGSVPFLPSVVTEPSGQRLDSGVDGTSVLIPTLLDQPVLPFGVTAEIPSGEAQPLAQPLAAAVAHSEAEGSDESVSEEPTATMAPADPATVRREAVPRRPPDELDTTHMIPLLVLDEEPPPQDALPEQAMPSAAGDDRVCDFGAVPGEPALQLTLEQLASLHAELATGVEQATVIRTRYRLQDEASQRRLEARWRQRFAAHPEERARYELKLREFQAWLAGRQR